MASITILIAVIFSIAVLSSADFVTVKCHSSIGYAGQPSKLHCVLKTEESPEIEQVFWRYEDNVVLIVKDDVETEQGRFKLADAAWRTSKDISLLVGDTKISDQGRYGYTVVTNMGITTGETRLDVKATYSQPVTTYKLDKDEKKVDLTCTAKGGYPKGAIHWFDGHDTNWTRGAQTTVTEEADKSFTLHSTYTSADASYAPYRCVVFNSEWKEEGKELVELDITQPSKQSSSVETKHIAAGVVVIGSLICGLLVALLICKRRSQRLEHQDYFDPPDPEAGKGLEHQDYFDPPDPEAGKELKMEADKDVEPKSL